MLERIKGRGRGGQTENWQEAEFAGFQRLLCFSRTEQVGDTVSFTKKCSFRE